MSDHPFKEIEDKYGIAENGEADLTPRIDEVIEFLKTELRRELKLKEGAEKLRRATSDKNSSTQARNMVKKSNSRLLELQKDLGDLNNFRLFVVGGDARHGRQSVGFWLS